MGNYQRFKRYRAGKKEVRFWISEQDDLLIKEIKQGRSYPQMLLSIRYLMKQPAYQQAVINSQLDHLQADLPPEMYGIVSAVRVLLLRAINLDPTSQEELCKRIVELLRERIKETNVGVTP